jgi:uncharacterized RDD family membrane protein YckC
MNEDGRDAETLSGSQAPTVPGSPPSDSSSPPIAVFRPSLPVGEKFGSYLLLRALGKGGMGEVYEAEHEETRRRVALKVLSRGLEGPTDRARFLREGRLAASVSHPNSVYIYGTDEIEGTAVIAMELVSGGTLKDRVERQGPLRPADAVDAILQVIDGLEAAAAKGVLHRDVKPSNCFVDRDGTVKIGDFGLSMSTLSRAESHLTATGTFLGTPAFASPEQVRCDEVDIRSDIYSVSATLYYLVTGRAPFEGDRMGRLLSSVLERVPEPPRRFRSDLPAGLERVIQRGLQKKPSARFPDYAALRGELAPFGSTAPFAATLTRRVGASVLDNLLISGLPGACAGFLDAMQRRKGLQPIATQHFDPLSLALLGVSLLYYTLLEGLQGASLGKKILGLRVVGPDRGVPGLWRAFIRTCIFIAGSDLISPAVSLALWHASHPESGIPHALHHILDSTSFLLLFVTARRGNGFAGLHDLVSGTRVVRNVPRRVRAVAATADEGIGVEPAEGRVGTFTVRYVLWGAGRERLLRAVDEQLGRWVWVHVRPRDAPSVAPARRSLSRPGRLRWLNGKCEEEHCWDAYEAPDGRALADEIAAACALGEKLRWEPVRFWLLDLAQELAAGFEDQTTPSDLGLDRVWITNDGRAKLLDFPAPTRHAWPPASAVPVVAQDVPFVQRFLRQVCVAALRGPVPLYARSWIEGLAREAESDPEAVVASLNATLERPTSVSVGRRVCHLLLCGLLALGFGLATRPAVPEAGIFASIAVVALISAFLFRGGLLLRLLGISVVTKDGLDISRLRASFRSVTGWSPYWILALACLIAGLAGFTLDVPLMILALFLAYALLELVPASNTEIDPGRGFQDRIAGTGLVPR